MHILLTLHVLCSCSPVGWTAGRSSIRRVSAGGRLARLYYVKRHYHIYHFHYSITTTTGRYLLCTSQNSTCIYHVCVVRTSTCTDGMILVGSHTGTGRLLPGEQLWLRVRVGRDVATALPGGTLHTCMYACTVFTILKPETRKERGHAALGAGTCRCGHVIGRRRPVVVPLSNAKPCRPLCIAERRL